MSFLKNIACIFEIKFTESLIAITMLGFLTACGGGGGEGSAEDVPVVSTQAKLNLEVSGNGTIDVNNGAASCTSQCSSTLNINTQVELTAAPDLGYEFEQWTGACSGNGTCSIMLSENKTIAAVFVAETIEPPAFTLNVSLTGNGSVQSTDNGINCGSDCSEEYIDGKPISLAATAATGYSFEKWTGACNGNGTCNLVMSADTAVAAVFILDAAPNNYLLSVAVSGSGSVSSNPAGINCGSDCSQLYLENTQVALQASPLTGFEFQQWGGACSGSGGCVVSMNTAQNVTAVFVAETVNEFALNVAVNGNGRINSNPAGINCGSDCSQNYALNTQVSLQATAQSGSIFQNWSGACSGSGTCNVTMNSARNVIAVFATEAAEEFNLTVSVSGNGSVTSNPTGINCGSDCAQLYTADTQVTLQATPQSGYVLEQWGGACTGGNTCVVTMTQAKSVTATFKLEPVDPQLTVNFNGNGSVTSNPGGIDCTADCSVEFTENTQVSLTAVADDGWDFSSWSGECSGSSSCNVTITADTIVTANFVEEERNLNVTVTGQGSVTSNPAGINCGSDCTESLTYNSQVSLSTIPQSGYLFDHWTGDCNGNGSCSLTMSADKSVTAVFVEDTGQETGIKIEDYSAANDAFTLAEVPNNASGITWHEELQQFLVIRNNAGQVYRYDNNFAYLGQLHISGVNQDTEGLAFIGNNEVMVVNEQNYAHKIVIDEFTESVNGDVNVSQAYRLLPRAASNAGLEGVAVRKAVNGGLTRVYACQEGGNGQNMRVVYFDVPAVDPLVLLSYDSNLEVVEPFNADQAFAGQVNDLAGMVYDERTGHLIIVSQQSRKAIQVDPDTGAIISTLSLSGAPQFEGVTIGPNGELVFVSEANWIRIYTRP